MIPWVIIKRQSKAIAKRTLDNKVLKEQNRVKVRQFRIDMKELNNNNQLQRKELKKIIQYHKGELKLRDREIKRNRRILKNVSSIISNGKNRERRN